MALTGQENVWNVHNLILEDYKGTSTFHFFSEWFVAFWVKITDFQSIYIQEIISYAFFAFLSTIGILAILEYYKASINLVDVVLASITTLFFKCIFIFEFKGISFFTFNAFGMPKLWIIYVVIISTLLQILYQNQLVAVLNLLFLPIFYFTAAAAVFSATTSYSFISFLLAQNKQDKANYLKAILISILSFLLIMLFYYLTSSSIAAFNTEKYPYVKTWINVVGGTCIQVLFLLLPFSVLLLLANVFNYKKFNLMELLLEFKNFIQKHLLLILIIFWGILVWATFHFIIDSVQLFQNVGVVTLNLLILNSIFYFGIKFNNKLVFYGLLITILAINLYQTSLRRANQFYSQEYIENIALLLQKYQPNPIGACLFGKENYYPENHDYYINHKYSVNTNSSVLGSQLKYIANFYNAVCITSMEIPNQEDAFVRSMVEKSCFYLYYKKYNLTDITEAKKRFIEQYKIKYVLASKFADISFLKNQILTIVEDKNTAEKFILLK
ncbi:MAG: hypothetical protein NZ516_02285 [Raineya sp.]|nr:hypothetical protein [Raineya sp.]